MCLQSRLVSLSFSLFVNEIILKSLRISMKFLERVGLIISWNSRLDFKLI